MATLTQIRTKLARALMDKNLRYLDATALDAIINEAQDQFALDTEILERITGLAVTAGVNRVAQPTDMIRPTKFVYRDYWPMGPTNIVEFTEQLGFYGPFSSRPFKWEIFENDILLNPSPSESSPTTTMNDTGGISASDTSVTLADASAFPVNGIIIIQSEVIEFFNRSGNVLNNLRRGIGGSVAATHADTTAVTLCLMRVAYSARFKTLTVDADVSEVPDRYIHVLVDQAASMAFNSANELALSERHRGLYEAAIEKIKAAAAEKQRERPERVMSIDRNSRVWM